MKSSKGAASAKRGAASDQAENIMEGPRQPFSLHSPTGLLLVALWYALRGTLLRLKTSAMVLVEALVHEEHK